MGQLLTEVVNGEMVNEMTYDGYGNILTKNGKTYTYGDSVWKDKLTAVDGNAIKYDDQGNPTTYLGYALTWEKGRQLKTFGTNSYTYNANGIRTSKTVNGVTHTYTLDGTNILCEKWDNNTLIPLRDNEDQICGILYNGTPYYFLKNLQGDIIAIQDSNAQTVARYTYDAWGVCTITEDTTDITIATINPYRYRGYYYDTEISMYYLQSRYYDPAVGRFVNEDDVRLIATQSNSTELNLFRYCENDPINNVDIAGKIAAKLIARIIIGAIIGFLVQLLSDLIAIWFANLFGKKVSQVLSNGGDYVSSMISWALTCVSFNRKVVEIIATLLPVCIKQVSRIFNKSFDWIDFMIDIALAIVSFIISKCLGKAAKNKLAKIVKKAGKKNGSWHVIRVKSKRLNLKMNVLGMKFNLGLNIGSFFISSIYSLASCLF